MNKQLNVEFHLIKVDVNWEVKLIIVYGKKMMIQE